MRIEEFHFVKTFLSESTVPKLVVFVVRTISTINSKLMLLTALIASRLRKKLSIVMRFAIAIVMGEWSETHAQCLATFVKSLFPNIYHPTLLQLSVPGQ